MLDVMHDEQPLAPLSKAVVGVGGIEYGND